MIITIDGPSGSGKSTVARKLARTLAFLYINQGAFFRAVAVVARERGVDLGDEAGVLAVAGSLDFALCVQDEPENRSGLLLDGEDRSADLLSAEAGGLASTVAVLPKLRVHLLEMQRKLLGSNSAVVEGRDAGSVGFPEAELKLYLDAKAEVRAQRRFEELQLAGDTADADSGLSVEALAAQMKARDEQDSAREVAPLQIPEDAHVVDTSEFAVEEVVKQLVSLANARLK